ncbi:MAG: hypothetical protein FJ219_00530 [Ignavibacteria bacterium]|nr:hypothetical protein [Ignavibacteria bacterium]
MRMFILLMGSLFIGCTSTPSTCINDRTIGTIIRWGDGELGKGSYSGYEMHAKELALYAVNKPDATSSMSLVILDSIESRLFCGKLQDIVGTFTAIQSLYSPGKTYRSVEYVNTKTNVHMKAIWNPEFTTFGSKEFRAIYDSLMLAVPPIPKAQHEK